MFKEGRRAIKASSSFVRRNEKAFLLAALVFSALAPLVKYATSLSSLSSSNEWSTAASRAQPVELQDHGRGAEDYDLDPIPEPAVARNEAADTFALMSPIVCTYAEHELAKWQACNKKKFKSIPSCKRGIGKCILLPLYKQKLTPFCSECMNEWKKIEDCFQEAETYALTQRRCVKVREITKRKICGVRSGPGDKEGGQPFRVSRDCMTANTKIVRATAELAKIRKVAPKALEAAERQERLQKTQQRRGRGRRRGKAKRSPTTPRPPPRAEEEEEDMVEHLSSSAQAQQQEGSKIDYGRVEINSIQQS